MRKIILIVLIGIFGHIFFACDKYDEEIVEDKGIDCSYCKDDTTVYYIDEDRYECLKFLDNGENVQFIDNMENEIEFSKKSYKNYVETDYIYITIPCGYDGCWSYHYSAYEFIEYVFKSNSSALEGVKISYKFELYYVSVEFEYESSMGLDTHFDSGGFLTDSVKINQNIFYDVYVNYNTSGDTLFYNNSYGVVGFVCENEKYSLKQE